MAVICVGGRHANNDVFTQAQRHPLAYNLLKACHRHERCRHIEKDARGSRQCLQELFIDFTSLVLGDKGDIVIDGFYRGLADSGNTDPCRFFDRGFFGEQRLT